MLIDVGRLADADQPDLGRPGRTYGVDWGTLSRKTMGPPPIIPDDLGPIDFVLLSQDQHARQPGRRGSRVPPGAGMVSQPTSSLSSHPFRSPAIVLARPERSSAGS